MAVSGSSVASVPFYDLAALHATLRSELDAAYRDVMDGGVFVLGPRLLRFEREFADYCGVAEAVGVADGLAAIQLILEALEIGSGDEVIVPGCTFIATWLAVSRLGATPVPADVDPRTYTLDPMAVQRAITPRTRAVIAVHLYGHPADTTALRALCEAHGVQLIEDAAQAHGAVWQGRRAGGLGVAAAFSFYPGKNLGALGDGGAVTTNDRSLADRIRQLRNYGARAKYEHELAGPNSRLDELQAAFLSVKLQHLDRWNARRTQIAERYLQELADLDIVLPWVAPLAQSAWHLFVVQHHDRDRLRAELAEHGIETSIHYPVNPGDQGAYGSLAFDRQRIPVSQAVAPRVLSLPMSPAMSDEQVGRVIDACRRVLR